ncbi:MAG: glycosyltransferase [Chloroflexi bacterium]|nr:glycosyltransferase [Chloroflexota bacterium]
MAVLPWVYVTVALWLALYGFNALLLALAFLWKHPHDPPLPPPPEEWPQVTVQLPVYNEIHVIARLLHAVANLDYPSDRLEIQVLDDSDDETTWVIRGLVRRLRSQGVNIQHMRRPRREGYKAGALAYGLERAHGEFIAILDADFVPPQDWLRRTVPHLVGNPTLAFVQTRWEHLNASASPITLAQSLALDGHFAVEQPTRGALGWPIAFNGSAGIWRKAAILDAGNWQADTLCEDLDLSYRAQLGGWQGLVLTDITVPGEIPPLIRAFRRQQARWATGSIQTFRKLGMALVRARHLSPGARLQGLIHQTNYLVHPLMVLLILLTWPLLYWQVRIPFPLAYLGIAGLGPPLVYVLAQQKLRGHVQRAWAFPLLLLLGLGIAWHSTRAVVRGLTRWGAPFERTPKFRLEGRTNAWQGKRYSVSPWEIPWGELGLAAYTGWVAWWAYTHALGYIVPLLLVYSISFAWVGGGVLWEQWQARRRQKSFRTTPVPMWSHKWHISPRGDKG